MDGKPSVEELLRQTAARRERLQQYRRENQEGKGDTTVETTTETRTIEMTKISVKENVLSDTNVTSTHATIPHVPEQLKKTLTSLADQYRSVDEEDSQTESICSGNLSERRSSTQRGNITPRKNSRTSSTSVSNLPNSTSSPLSREKREHVTCGDSPRLHGPKLLKPENPTTFNFPSPTGKVAPISDPEILTLKERKAVFERATNAESRSSPKKTVTADFRRNLFQEAAVKSQDPNFPKKELTRGKSREKSAEPGSPKTPEIIASVASRKLMFNHPLPETSKEVGEITRNLQDKLLEQTKAWKHNDVSMKIEEQKQEDMAVLKKRWELMAEEEKKASERANLVEQALKKQRSKGIPPVRIEGPPPLPVPGSSSLQERPSKPMSTIPAPVAKTGPPAAQLNPVPVPKSVDITVVKQAAPAKQTARVTGIPPPPPPPPLLYPALPPISPSAYLPPQVQTTTKVVAAAASKKVRMRLPEEEGTDLSTEEEEVEDYQVQYGYASSAEGEAMEYEEYQSALHSEVAERPMQEMSSEDSSTEEMPPRSGILKKKETDVLYVYEHREDNQSVSSTETASSNGGPISLSFYRKSQKKSFVPKSPKADLHRFDPSFTSTIESVEDKRREFVASLEAKIDELYRLSSQQHATLIQTTAALNLCKSSAEFQGSSERAECERILLWAEKRREAFHAEIERLKSVIHHVKVDRVIPESRPLGKVTLSNMVVPTKEGFSEYVRTETGMMHYFLMLGRCREDVHVSEMLNSVQHLEADGTFHFTSTTMDFEAWGTDFIVHLEIYAVQAKRETVSHNEKYHIRESPRKKGKTGFLKKLLPHIKEDGHSHTTPPTTPSKHQIRVSSFGRVGSCVVTLSNLHDTAFRLTDVPSQSAVDAVMHLKAVCVFA